MIKAALVSAIVLASVHHNPALPPPIGIELPGGIDTGSLPEIQTGKIFTNKGAKYLCGTASISSRHDDFRFLVALETDWQTYEPSPNGINTETWQSWDKTYSNFCHNTEANAQWFPDIISGKFVIHKDDKFICGIAEDSRKHGELIRYVVSTKVDWQIWEPSSDDETWAGWNTTYDEICGPETEE